MHRAVFLAAGAAWILATLACALPSAGGLDEAQVATAVSATMAAGTAVGHGVGEPTAASGPPQAPAETLAAPEAGGDQQLVYTSGGDVWLIEEAAPARQLTATGGVYQVTISSDGEKIVFVRRASVDSPSEVWTVNRDGTGQAQLVASTRWNQLHDPAGFLFNDLSAIEFIPGSYALLLNTQAVPEGPGVFQYDDLLRLDADTGELSELLPAGQGGAFALSPDGTTAAIVRPTSIGLVGTDGSDLRPDRVTFPMVITYSEYLWYPKVVWSPDSTSAGVAIPSADPLAADPTGTIWTLPKDGGAAIAWSTIPGNFFFSQFGAPSVAPSLGRVAFAREGAAPNTSDLYLANLDGSGETLYVSGDAAWRGWAPDGEHFAYSLDSPTNLMLGAVGASPLPLATGHNLQWVTSTDFLVISGGEGSWTLSRGSIGGPVVPLATPAGDFVAYDISLR